MGILDHEPIAGHLSLPEEDLQGASDNLAAFRADNSEGFAQYGISEGMYIIIDLDKPHRPGQLSCFYLVADLDQPRYKIAHKAPEGYCHLGRVLHVTSEV